MKKLFLVSLSISMLAVPDAAGPTREELDALAALSKTALAREDVRRDTVLSGARLCTERFVADVYGGINALHRRLAEHNWSLAQVTVGFALGYWSKGRVAAVARCVRAASRR